jgi:hypothetical protein
MAHKDNPETKDDRLSKDPMAVGDRGQDRPGAGEQNAHKVDDAALRDADGGGAGAGGDEGALDDEQVHQDR